MVRRNINELYFPNRFFPMSAMKVLVLLPIGVLLLPIRLLIGLLIYFLGIYLPKICFFAGLHRTICNLFIAMLGISVHTEDASNREEVEAYVSNCITPYDPLILHHLTDSVKPEKELFNSVISLALGIQPFGSVENFVNFKKKIEQSITEKKFPLHFQPECKQTNGYAVLNFKTWPFQLCKRVQPVAIEVTRPVWNVRVSSFNSKFWADTLWYLLSPCTCYNVRFLPVVEKNNMSPEDFAEKVRKNIADSLQVELSEYSANDLIEWEKRVVQSLERMGTLDSHLLQLPRNTIQSTTNPEIQRMTRQVQDVFPLVPYRAIYTDLLTTRSTDQTITNILEGRVTYVTEPTSSHKISPTNNYVASTSNNTAKLDTSSKLAGFGKTAKERMLSFQERKEQLIESARKKYMEKHGLDSS